MNRLPDTIALPVRARLGCVYERGSVRGLLTAHATADGKSPPQAVAEAAALAINAHGEIVAALRRVVDWNVARGRDDVPLPIEQQTAEIAAAIRALERVGAWP